MVRMTQRWPRRDMGPVMRGWGGTSAVGCALTTIHQGLGITRSMGAGRNRRKLMIVLVCVLLLC